MTETPASAVLEAALDAIVTIDADGIMQRVNGAAERLFGYRPGELTGRDVAMLMPRSYAAQHKRALRRHRENGESRILNGRHRFEGLRRDGTRFPLWLSVAEFTDGGSHYFVGVMQDLTERHHLRNRAAHYARDLRTAREENERVRQILEGINASTWDWDLQTGELVLGERWAQFVGRSVDEIERTDLRAWSDAIHPDDLPAVESPLQQHLAGTLDYYDAEFRVAHTHGGYVWINARGRIVARDSAGRPVRMSGTHLDITKRKQAERALASSEARYRSVVENVRDIVFQTDADGRWSFLNPAWEEVTGSSVDEALGTPLLDSIHPDDRPLIEAEIEPLRERRQDFFRRELRYHSRNRSAWIEIHAQAALDSAGRFKGMSGTLRDVSRQHEAEQARLRLVYYDALTELPNRALALDRLSELLLAAQRRDERVAVLFVDLDDFKKVNDTLGHETGDRLLPEAGRRLAAVVRKQDTVARLGGDEFLVLLGGLGREEDTQHSLKDLLECLRQPFTVDGRELVLTASVGIAIAPTDGDTPQDLLRNADMAMYRSKSEGGNSFHYFTETMNRDMARRFRIEEALRGALARREFQVVFQPLVDLSTGTVVGAETLLRWDTAGLGEIAPAEFIPIAEQTGLIGPIGDHVAEQALAHAGTWVEQSRGRFRISINVSPQQFRDPQLTARIGRLLERNGVPPEALEIEITEGVLLAGHERVGEALGALRDLGAGIAMDDFGTGYASLSYLRQYPFDTLKIDQSFVRDCTDDPNDRELVITSLRLASGLGLRAIAEGVETDAHATFLRDQDCHLAQGFLFSPPVTAEDMTRLVRSGLPRESAPARVENSP